MTPAVYAGLKTEYFLDPKALVTLDNGDILVFSNNSGLYQYFDASVLHLDAGGNFIKETVWGNPDDQDDWYDAKKMPDGSVVAVGMSRLSSEFIQQGHVACGSPPQGSYSGKKCMTPANCCLFTGYCPFLQAGSL
jgi:hypothetical protein